MPHVARARNGLCWSGLDSARDARTARRAGRRQVVIATRPACDSEGNLDFLETEKRSRSEDIATARTLPCVSLGSRGSIRWTVGVVCFAEELSSRIVQRGRRPPKAIPFNDLDDGRGNDSRNSLILWVLQAWLAALDDFRNWL